MKKYIFGFVAGDIRPPFCRWRQETIEEERFEESLKDLSAYTITPVRVIDPKIHRSSRLIVYTVAKGSTFVDYFGRTRPIDATAPAMFGEYEGRIVVAGLRGKLSAEMKDLFVYVMAERWPV